jgi:hypothetical protein
LTTPPGRFARGDPGYLALTVFCVPVRLPLQPRGTAPQVAVAKANS